MAVPEAAVHQDYCLVLRENNVRLTREVAPPERKPIAHSVNRRAHSKFRGGISATYPRHIPATFFCSQAISHIIASIGRKTLLLSAGSVECQHSLVRPSSHVIRRKACINIIEWPLFLQGASSIGLLFCAFRCSAIGRISKQGL